MSKIVGFKGIEIVIRTRDEHCEPHVHVFHTGQDWELRVFFSYVSRQITDVELLHGRVPRQAIVQAVMNKVIDNLDRVREVFWDAVQTVCLDNKYIAVVNGVAQTARREAADALRVETARYLADVKSIECTLRGRAVPLIVKCP
jgi:hypothetical protein